MIYVIALMAIVILIMAISIVVIWDELKCCKRSVFRLKADIKNYELAIKIARRDLD